MAKIEDIKEGIRKYFGEIIPKIDDEPWQQWVDFKPRTHNDLAELLKQDVRDSIKWRAIFFLLVPELDWSPFYWPANTISREWPGHLSNFINDLPSDLVKYTAKWINEFCEALRLDYCGISEEAVVDMPGFQILTRNPEKYHSVLVFYNACILKLLAILPADSEEAARLFGNFSLRDIPVFASQDNPSGYKPFMSLMFDPGIDKKWKLAADAKMRGIVLAEKRGDIKPRAEWETAGLWYAKLIQSAAADFASFHYADPYDIDVMVDQIKFVLDNELTNLAYWNEAEYILSVLYYGGAHNWRDRLEKGHRGKVEHKELFHCFSRAIVLDRPFSINDYKMQSAAQIMLAELADEDQELASVLISALGVYNSRIEEAEKNDVVRRAQQEKIMAALK